MAVDRGNWAGMVPVSLAIGALFAINSLGRADTLERNSAIKPVPRDPGWVKRHEGFIAEAKKGDVDVLFLGDSITDGWRGQAAWKKYFAPMKAANFGIGGDRTEHVLWRLQNGELEGIDPKVVVLMIGTNNSGSNSAAQIADGVKAIVHEIRERKPNTQILLLGVFPRGPKASDPLRDKLKEVNERISKLDDGQHVRYMDIGEKFLDTEGNLPRDIMPDYLHPNAKGYDIWAAAIEPTLNEMLKK